MSTPIYTPSPTDEIFSYPHPIIDWDADEEVLIYQHLSQDQWGSNNPNWGNHQPQSAEHKAKKAKAKCREIEIEGVLYSSGKAAAESLNYGVSAISQWATKNGSRYGIAIPKGSNQYARRNIN